VVKDGKPWVLVEAQVSAFRPASSNLLLQDSAVRTQACGYTEAVLK